MKVVTATEMRQIDSDTIERIGIPGIVLMETAGSAIVRSIQRDYPDCRRIGVFVGKGNNGGDGLVIARQLAHADYDVHIFLVSPAESFTGDAATNLHIAQNLGLPMEEILTDSVETLPRTQTTATHTVARGPVPRQELPMEEILTDSVETLSRAQTIGPDTVARGPVPRDAQCELFVDAIFGTGLRRPVVGEIADVIEGINRLPVQVIAVDLPSGLDADTGQPLGACIRADKTVTIGLPKRGLLLHPGAEFAGKLEVADIGFPKSVVDAQNIGVNWTTAQDAASWVPPRPRASHKGSYGRVLVIAGSTGMTGAAALASEAALRSGAGLVTLAIPKSLNPILEVKLSEVMTLPLPETEAGSLADAAAEPILEFAKKTKSVMAIGPGLSQHPETVSLVHRLVQAKSAFGKVIDADGLNALAPNTSVTGDRLPPHKSGPVARKLSETDIVLTPHPGEMARLIGTTIPQIEAARIGTAQQFAQEWGVTLLLKGAPTVTAHADGSTWINATGHPGMATAGMGDVLTGIIAGLMAQGLSGERAAVLGSYLHGLAGDIAAEALGMHGLIASDVLNAVPQAIISNSL